MNHAHNRPKTHTHVNVPNLMPGHLSGHAKVPQMKGNTTTASGYCAMCVDLAMLALSAIVSARNTCTHE